MLKGIYAITDTTLTPYDNINNVVESALKGGVKIIQLRDKINSDDFLEHIAISLRNIIHRYNALFIINDRVSLAKKINADGVHLGDGDYGLREARRMLGNKIIGISCYGDIKKAIDAEHHQADYVAFGSVFSSPTKNEAKVIGVDIFDEIKKHISIPVCAIGGITIDNIQDIRQDVEMKAVISGLWGDDVRDKAIKFANKS